MPPVIVRAGELVLVGESDGPSPDRCFLSGLTGATLVTMHLGILAGATLPIHNSRLLTGSGSLRDYTPIADRQQRHHGAHGSAVGRLRSFTGPLAPTTVTSTPVKFSLPPTHLSPGGMAADDPDRDDTTLPFALVATLRLVRRTGRDLQGQVISLAEFAAALNDADIVPAFNPEFRHNPHLSQLFLPLDPSLETLAASLSRLREPETSRTLADQVTAVLDWVSTASGLTGLNTTASLGHVSGVSGVWISWPDEVLYPDLLDAFLGPDLVTTGSRSTQIFIPTGESLPALAHTAGWKPAPSSPERAGALENVLAGALATAPVTYN